MVHKKAHVLWPLHKSSGNIPESFAMVSKGQTTHCAAAKWDSSHMAKMSSAVSALLSKFYDEQLG
jgi:hypothetical protein